MSIGERGTQSAAAQKRDQELGVGDMLPKLGNPSSQRTPEGHFWFASVVLGFMAGAFLIRGDFGASGGCVAASACATGIGKWMAERSGRGVGC
jgi:hypothetical protein